MKTIIINLKRIILLHIIFLGIIYPVSAQLLDPFGKIITHEIKLTKLNDGAYMGAMEWTTGGIDSLQRFVVNGLDVKSPVMVRVVSKAPKHNIDISFHKSKWDKVESKISTKGDKFVDKIFRTMNTAGIGVSSKVAGIPYLIIVKVGLEFPSTKSLIRITDNIEEYNTHLRKMGLSGDVIGNTTNGSGTSTSSGESTEENNNTLMYIIIGLLVLIIFILGIFLLRKLKPKSTLTLLLLFGFSTLTIAQSKQPKLVPVSGQGESPVFFEYSNQNVGNQTPVQGKSSTDKDGRIYTPTNIELGSGVKELTGDEAAIVNQRMQEANEQFDTNYRDEELGEETEGDQRTLPTDRTNEELDALRQQVRRLQAQVDLLSQEDEQFEEEDVDGEEIVLYCEDIPLCKQCMDIGLQKFGAHYAYMDYLQKFYASEMSSINTQIAYGNSLASIPGAGLGWGPILQNRVMPAVNNLKQAYSKKFDEYIASMKKDLNEIRACHTGENSSFPSSNTVYQAQVKTVIERLKASKIIL